MPSDAEDSASESAVESKTKKKKKAGAMQRLMKSKTVRAVREKSIVVKKKAMVLCA